MSEKPQRQPDVSEANVSRETSETTPEQTMLNEILDRAMVKYEGAPKEDAGQEAPPQEKPLSQINEGALSSAPEKNKPSSAYIYLAVLFGAAFLMLLLAYFVQQRNNDAVLDDLRTTTASREELLEDIKALEEELEQLQKDAAYYKDRATQLKGESENYRISFESASQHANDQRILNYTLKYFWYITQFMENKEYPMAAAAVVFGADFWRETWNQQISVNPAQVEQYEAHRQELIDKGYLQQLDHAREGGTDIWFTDKWNPSQREDMAALCILWCALDKHFTEKNDDAASQHLYHYPMGDPSTGYQEQVERLASKFTLEQFQILKDELVENKWLVIAEDGTMSEGPGPDEVKLDVLYGFPFDLPLDTLSKNPIS